MDIIDELSTRVATLERTVHGLMYRDQVEKKAAEVYNDTGSSGSGRIMVRGDIVDWSSRPKIAVIPWAWTSASEEAINEHRRKPPRAEFNVFTVGQTVWWHDESWKTPGVVTKLHIDPDGQAPTNYTVNWGSEAMTTITINYAKDLCASNDLQAKRAPDGLDNGLQDREAYLKAWWDTRHTRGRYNGEHT